MALAQSIAALFSRFAARSFRSVDPAQISPHALGALGERLAARHLKRNGYRVLYRNFKAPHGGEVDIVCRDKRRNALVFVEVKTRRTLQFGNPGEAVNEEKRCLISRGALPWLRPLGNPDICFRFDIVEVVFEASEPRLHVIEDAFPLPEQYRY